MQTCKLFLLLAVILFLATAAFGQPVHTGNDVLSKCQTAVRWLDNGGAPVSELMDVGWCQGWVGAALELTRSYNEWTDFTKQKPTVPQFCLPDSGIPLIQAIRVVVKYLQENPDQLHEDGMGLTIAALKGSFPCKR
ncbi:MAG: Rap1a/Tai family immunity protein [Terriglobales bacterium]